MFEQTLLTQPASAQKTGAFAISLTAQMCVFGVLIVGPLLYTQKLPFIAPIGPLLVTPPPPPPPPVPVRELPPTASGPTVGSSVRRIFVRSEPSGPTIYPAQHAVVIDPGTTDIAEPIGNIGVGDPTVGRVVGNTPGPPPTVPTTQATVVTPAVEPAAKPVPLSSTVLASKLITKVVPQYPSAARAVHVSGLVRLLALIGVDGHVKSLRVMEGHPLLRKAAEDAVSQWIYSPTTLNGRPVEVEASIEVNFTLNN